MSLRTLWSRLTGRAPAPGRDSGPTEKSLQSVLVERFAAHFPGAVVKGAEVALPFGGLTVRCQVNNVGGKGDLRSAALFFWIAGGPFDNSPVFASVSGYGPTPMQAVVIGCCNWACAFAPVLRAVAGEAATTDLQSFDVSVDGQRLRVFIDGLDRAMVTGDDDAAPEAAIREARGRLGREGWLLRRVLEEGPLPILRSDRPVLLSAFVFDGGPPPRVVEIKVNGGDWRPAHASLAAVEGTASGGLPFLRELAAAVPLGPAPALSRAAVERTLAGLAVPGGEGPRRSFTWRGFRAHDGRLGAPLAAAELAALEHEAQALPDDYRAFLREVGAAGAGPGYGLLSPLHPGQRALLRRSDPPGPALALAHGGCGITWLLALEGAPRGEVWVDARSGDGTLRRVDGSFAEWYRRWLDAAVRDVFPWGEWDSSGCAGTDVIVKVIKKVEEDGVPEEARAERLRAMLKPGSIRLSSGDTDFFAQGDRIDPCAGCVNVATFFGLDEDRFAAGVPSLQSR